MHNFKCSYCVCGTSESRWNVEHYETRRQDKKVFQCETCGKLFTKKFNLERHTKKAHIEKEESQLKCSRCDYETSRKADLNRHVESKHNKSNFACSVCNKYLVGRTI